jgi:membrane protein XagC
VTRLLASLPIALLVFVCILTIAAAAVRTGLVADDAVMLWAGAITAADGGMSMGLIAAAYPSIPFLASTMIELAAPSGTPAPALLAAVIAGLLAETWYLSMRAAGLSLLAALATTLLLIFHPGLLRTAIAGPSEILFVAFLYMLGCALFSLRVRSGVPEVMKVGLALLGLAFSHPMGAAMACAAVPFLIFAVRPSLVANSAINVVLTLVFPTVFSAAAFAYVSWVFPGSGWTFLIAPVEGMSTWTASFTRGLGGAMTGVIALDVAIATALAFVFGAPIVLIVLMWVMRRRPLVTPTLVIVAMTVAAASLAVATGLFGDPLAVTAVPPVLAAIMITRVPDFCARLRIVLPLLAIGWFGGAGGLAIVDPRIIAQVAAAARYAGADPARADGLDLGGEIISREGVLVDSVNAPAVVVGRGTAVGLITPPDEVFSLAMLTFRIETPFVAVPNPQSNVGAQDRLNKAFPQLYERGPRGYQLVYHNANWRLFGRITTQDGAPERRRP